MFKKRVVKDSSSGSKRKTNVLEQDEQVETTPQDEHRAVKRSKLTNSNTSTSTTAKKSAPIPTSTTSSLLSKSQDEQEDVPKSTVAKQSSSIKPVPESINITTIMDFQPDVCKDFQQTGYCGYGDTCKFLHIRDESRQKKPIKKDWEDVVTNKKSSQKEDGISTTTMPFNCIICKKDYKSPIKTQCGHLFCQACFLNRYKVQKKSGCAICNKDVEGVMIPVSKRELEELIG